MAKARARVTLTLLVDVEDVWGDDCPISQVRMQAARSAVGKLNHAIYPRGDGAIGGYDYQRGPFHLVHNSIKVEAIILDDK